MPDVVFETSGSTGVPKRIARTESSLQADAAALVAAFPEIWSSHPRVLASIRPEHMFGALWRQRAPRLAGCVVDPAILVSVEELLARASGDEPRLFVTTPSFLEKALLHPDFARLQGAFIGIVTSGSALRPETARAVEAALGVCPLEIYGSTEAGTIAWRRQTASDICTLMPDVTATTDEHGQLVVDSPHAMERPLVMPDVVTLLSPRQFRLCGRVDRQVKILEQLVSLTEVERVLSSHPAVARCRVESYGEDVPRLGALIVPHLDAPLDLAAELRRAFLTRLGRAAFPRRIRFVREMPVNEQGKLTALAVRRALLASCREPRVRAWHVAADSLQAQLVFTSDMECFRGHFPSEPVLPGVAQLVFVTAFARAVFADFPTIVDYRRLKFQRIVRPDELVEMTVARRAPRDFTVSLSVAGSLAFSSRIVEHVGASR